MSEHSFSRRLIDGVTMFVVTGLSLLLLVYVGFGEGKRIYEQFHTEKLTAHGRIVQNVMENYLRAGLPLNQYAGFTQLSEPLLQIQEIDALVVYDQTGRQVFLTVDKKNNPNLSDTTAISKRVKDDVIIEYGQSQYLVALPLRTRFETVGSLVVVSSTAIVGERLKLSFLPLLYVVLGLSFVFSIVVAIAAPYLARARMPWLQVGYAVTFLTMAGIVVATLVNLYSDGVQGKAQAAAMNLSQRVADVVEFNIRFRDFSGLDRTFSDYRRLNPEISEAALILDGTIQITTESSKVGKPWTSDARSYDYLVEVARPDSPRRVTIAVSVPKDLVYSRVERSVRNFAALFVASAFLAGLFLQVASSMQRVREAGASTPAATRARLSEETALIIVKPIFFLAVFLEHLTYSFLPQFMQQAASASGVSVGFASAPFTAYYLCFALILIPAGHFADRYGPRVLIWLGLVLASASVFGLVFPGGILQMTGLRALAGVGQGMLFIGIQAYILAVASPEKKTQGAAIIVFGFQGGMISGMAIGSLLVTYLHAQGVFVVGAAIGLATALYSILLIPGDLRRKEMKAGLGAAIRRVGSDLRSVVGSGEFLKTMFCIGVPAKAILTGTITFALPLLLTQQGYRQEEIGQIIMLYGMGVVTASGYISRVVDRTRNTESILFWGAAISGMGLVLVGLMGSPALGNGLASTLVVVAGVIVIGLAHGFINAPVVTHVAHSELAGRIGANPVTTTYRFLERAGHIAGPLLVGQLFLVWGQSPQILAWLGVATATLGVLFIVSKAPPPRVRAMGPETA